MKSGQYAHFADLEFLVRGEAYTRSLFWLVQLRKFILEHQYWKAVTGLMTLEEHRWWWSASAFFSPSTTAKRNGKHEASMSASPCETKAITTNPTPCTLPSSWWFVLSRRSRRKSLDILCAPHDRLAIFSDRNSECTACILGATERGYWRLTTSRRTLISRFP